MIMWQSWVQRGPWQSGRVGRTQRMCHTIISNTVSAATGQGPMMSTTATTWASGGVIEVMVVALPSSVGCGLHDLLYHSARSCLLACLLGTIVVVVVLTSSIIVLASSWRFLLWLASIEPRRHQGGRRAAHSWAKWQKTSQKLEWKQSWNWLVMLLMPATIWQILNIKRT